MRFKPFTYELDLPFVFVDVIFFMLIVKEAEEDLAF